MCDDAGIIIHYLFIIYSLFKHLRHMTSTYSCEQAEFVHVLPRLTGTIGIEPGSGTIILTLLGTVPIIAMEDRIEF